MTDRAQNGTQRPAALGAEGPVSPNRRVVVGVDGSDPSKVALVWAVRQARLIGAVVDAVIAWEVPLTVRALWPLTWGTDFRGLAEHLLADAIADVPDSAGKVEIRPKTLRGNPAQVLLEAAAGADLLVIGNRGHGGFVEALLGSVGQECAHRATCPVVVISGSFTGGGQDDGNGAGCGDRLRRLGCQHAGAGVGGWGGRIAPGSADRLPRA